MDFVLATWTFPKFRFEALTDKLPVDVAPDGELDAIFVVAHPNVNRMEKTNKKTDLQARIEAECTPSSSW